VEKQQDELSTASGNDSSKDQIKGKYRPKVNKDNKDKKEGSTTTDNTANVSTSDSGEDAMATGEGGERKKRDLPKIPEPDRRAFEDQQQKLTQGINECTQKINQCTQQIKEKVEERKTRQQLTYEAQENLIKFKKTKRNPP